MRPGPEADREDVVGAGGADVVAAGLLVSPDENQEDHDARPVPTDPSRSPQPRPHRAQARGRRASPRVAFYAVAAPSNRTRFGRQLINWGKRAKASLVASLVLE